MAIFNGNVVSFGSGGRWYVQMEVWDSGPTTADHVTVAYSYRIISSGAISDSSNTIQASDPWGSSTLSYPVSIGAGGGTVYPVGSPTNYSAGYIAYGYNNVLHFRFYVTGLATGGTGPSVVEFDYALPRRLPTTPAAPNLYYRDVTGTSVYLNSTWNDLGGGTPDEINYRINRDDNVTMGDIHGGWAGVAFTNLSRGRRYAAYAQVHNEAGWGPFCDPVWFTTSASVPDAPSSLAFSSITQTSAVLTWPAPYNGGAAITGYQAQFSDSATFATVLKDTNTGTLSANYSELILNTRYYARVRCMNVNGYSAWSATATFVTLPGPPNAPINLDVGGIVAGTALIQWGQPAANGTVVTGYQIQIANNSTFVAPLAKDTTTSVATPSYAATGLGSGGTYYVRVRANSAAGYSPWTTSGPLKDNSGLYITVGGVPYVGQLYITIGGAPKPGQLYITDGAGIPRLVG